MLKDYTCYLHYSDGTRWQDVFEYPRHFPAMAKYAKDGAFTVHQIISSMMEVASIPISLPSYQSQMLGLLPM